MEKYSITNLPKGMKGAVLRNGDFYSFDSVNNITACHNANFRYLTLEILKTDPRMLFENVRSQLEHPEYYDVNYSDYDYKALAIDFLGLCNFTIYGTHLGSYAAIEVPDPRIYGYKITKEEQDTLIKLVKINQCSLESLRPIFKEDNYCKIYSRNN